MKLHTEMEMRSMYASFVAGFSNRPSRKGQESVRSIYLNHAFDWDHNGPVVVFCIQSLHGWEDSGEERMRFEMEEARK